MHADEIRVVQFMHPGREHHPDVNGRKLWTEAKNGHRRTFVEQHGKFVRSRQDKHLESSDLHFWCEWECEAQLLREFDADRPSEDPRFLFRPQIEHKKRFFGLANTDPCVFGKVFRYCVCKMTGVMKKLARGSLILFGSHRKGQFLLDTVFVVAKHTCYDKSNWKKLSVEPQYRDAALAPLFTADKAGDDQCVSGERWRLYEGAMHNEPVDDMFSFFPCLPKRESQGFPRPAIQIPESVNPKLKMGLKTDGPVELSVAKDHWSSVVDQVTRAGLCLGVSAKMPDYSSADSG